MINELDDQVEDAFLERGVYVSGLDFATQFKFLQRRGWQSHVIAAKGDDWRVETIIAAYENRAKRFIREASAESKQQFLACVGAEHE